MARAGTPSLACSLTGRQIISYRPDRMAERSRPSMIQMLMLHHHPLSRRPASPVADYCAGTRQSPPDAFCVE
jgi:hypothetical protein